MRYNPHIKHNIKPPKPPKPYRNWLEIPVPNEVADKRDELKEFVRRAFTMGFFSYGDTLPICPYENSGFFPEPGSSYPTRTPGRTQTLRFAWYEGRRLAFRLNFEDPNQFSCEIFPYHNWESWYKKANPDPDYWP